MGYELRDLQQTDVAKYWRKIPKHLKDWESQKCPISANISSLSYAAYVIAFFTNKMFNKWTKILIQGLLQVMLLLGGNKGFGPSSYERGAYGWGEKTGIRA